MIVPWRFGRKGRRGNWFRILAWGWTIALLLGWGVGTAGPLLSSTLGNMPDVPEIYHSSQNSPVSLVYQPSDSPRHQHWQTWLQNSGILQDLIHRFHDTFHLVPALQVQVIDCRSPKSAPYLSTDWDQGKLYLCYELLDYLDRAFDDLSASQYEQHLAALDVTYVLVLAELARSLLTHLSQDSVHPPILTLASLSPIPPEDELLVMLPLLHRQTPPQVLESSLHQPANPFLPERDNPSQMEILLSGLLWMYNQGNLLPAIQRLSPVQTWDQSRYEALICLTYGTYPQAFPYFSAEFSEIPSFPFAQFQTCVQQTDRAIVHWRYQLGWILEP